MSIRTELIEELYSGLLTNDATRIRRALAPDVMYTIAGHEGRGVDDVCELIAGLHAATSGELRKWSGDSHDLLASEYHAVVLDRWRVDGTELDEHVTVLAAAVQDDGRVGIFALYAANADGLASFWGRPPN